MVAVWLFWTAKRLYATIASEPAGFKPNTFSSTPRVLIFVDAEAFDAEVERRRQQPEPPRVARKAVAIRSMENNRHGDARSACCTLCDKSAPPRKRPAFTGRADAGLKISWMPITCST